MHKILLVIKREYLARVKKKSFLLATLITPLIFPTIMGIFLWIAFTDSESEDRLRIIEVVDENNNFFMESEDNYAFSYSGIDVETAKELVKNGNRFGFLHIPKINLEKPAGITYFSDENPSMAFINNLESTLKRKIDELRLYNSGIDPKLISSLRTDVSIQAITLTSSGRETISNATVNYAIGFVTGILIYTFIFVYGNQIMQGVIEEKSSRIVEILISSLKPFQLMMGKILGIGAVGLTQFLIWILLISAVSSLVVGLFGQQLRQQQAMEMGNPANAALMEESGDLGQILEVLSGVNYIQLVLT